MARISDLTVNGDTHLVGKTYGTFSGPLSGNADTATKLQTARKLSLTGRIEGAMNFDGSADATINVKDVYATMVRQNITSSNHDIIAEVDDNGDPIMQIRTSGFKRSTNDPGNCIELAIYDAPVRVSQYSDSKLGTLSHQATLLDGSGNSTFPGSLTAAKVYNAIFNDYAEFFERGDENVEPGDIVALEEEDGETERYVRAKKDSKVIVGVCTDEFAHIIGGEEIEGEDPIEGNMKKFIPVSLMGRVHVKVTGPVEPGDNIVISDTEPGVGMAAPQNTSKMIVGTALTKNKNGKVRIMVSRMQ